MLGRFKNPWMVCISASFFFLYEFVQMSMFNSINLDVMRSLHLGISGLSTLSSCFFYSTALFLLPAGQILDRFSVKKSIIITFSLSIIGIIIFSFSSSLLAACIGRFLSGIGNAFCFLANFRLASRWFSEKKLALAAGIIAVIGMTGGIFSQTPLIFLVGLFGWRKVLLLYAFLGIIFLGIIIENVSDYPMIKLRSEESLFFNKNSYLSTWKLSYFNFKTWLCAMYSLLINSPIIILGASWGETYLEQARGFSHERSSIITMMLFVGSILGFLIIGRCSNKKNRNFFMFFSPLLSLPMMGYVIFGRTVSFELFVLIFFLTGLCTSTQILMYPIVSEGHKKHVSAMSSSILSCVNMSGYFILQPLFLFFLDKKPVCFFSNYQQALLIIPAGFAISAILVLLIRS